MNLYDKFSLTTATALLALLLAAIGGWVANAGKLVFMFADDGGFTMMLLGRLVGLFVFPVGGLLGYF